MAGLSPIPLQIDSVVKRYGSLTAVADVSLEVNERACLGLLGPNGAGKSTLIRTIAGRVLPDSGGVGWVPQELALYPLLTCRENLEAFGKYQGLRGSALRDGIAWCLEWAALADRVNATVKTLSGGMRRRLNMAAGLVHRPRLVLLDEPTVGVDPQSRNRIFEMVEGLRVDGATVIYTTHYMEEAERLCDSIAIIDHGRIIAQGPKEQLVEQSFGRRSKVLIRFASTAPCAAAWVGARGGTLEQNVAHFAVAQPAEIAALLEGAVQQGIEVVDVVLRRPNLESVFLHLTGRELRQ